MTPSGHWCALPVCSKLERIPVIWKHLSAPLARKELKISPLFVYHFLLFQYSAIRYSRLSISLPLISRSRISTAEASLLLLQYRLCPSLGLPGFQGRSVSSLLRTLPYFTMYLFFKYSQ